MQDLTITKYNLEWKGYFSCSVETVMLEHFTVLCTSFRNPGSVHYGVLRIVLQAMQLNHKYGGAFGSEIFLADLLLLDINGLGGNKGDIYFQIVGELIEQQFDHMELNLLNLLKRIRKVLFC